MSSDDLNIAFQQADPSHWLTGLALVLQHLPARDRAARVAELALAAKQDPATLAGLFVAIQAGRPVAAIWAQEMAGRAALIWGPEGRPAEVAGQLIAMAADFLLARGVRVLQALPRTAAQESSLDKAGFSSVVELAYLACPLRDCPLSPSPTGRPDSELEFETVQASSQDRLAAVIELTYTDTLDAPLLNGRRTRQEILDGYLATAHGDSSRWWLARNQQQDVGCLLLAEHAKHDHVELIYMGLIPQARGRGWGARLLQRALAEAATTGCSQLILAVDAANDPAIRIYSAAGFQPLRRQVVRLRFLES